MDIEEPGLWCCGVGCRLSHASEPERAGTASLTLLPGDLPQLLYPLCYFEFNKITVQLRGSEAKDRVEATYIP